MRCQCAWQLVWTGAQVRGPKRSFKLITGWTVTALSSLDARLYPSTIMSAHP